MAVERVLQSKILQLEGIEERYERYKEKIKNYTIMDDIFMRNVLKEQECTEYILQVIMNQKGLQIIEQTIQKDYKNLQGRSVILDCVAQDEKLVGDVNEEAARIITMAKEQADHTLSEAKLERKQHQQISLKMFHRVII